MKTDFSFNGIDYTEFDASESIRSAKESVASYFDVAKMRISGDESDFDILDDVIYESPSISEIDVSILAFLWADILAKQLGMQWYSCSINGRNLQVIALITPMVYVIYPEYRIHEGLSRGGASLKHIYSAVLLEIILSTGSKVLENTACELLRRNDEALKVLKMIVGPASANNAPS